MSRKLYTFHLYSVVLALVPSISSFAEVVKTDWTRFSEYEPWKNPKIPEALAKLNDQEIRMPGFMMPLGGDSKNAHEFLLVPSLPACEHVPASPPNLTILVKLKPGSLATNHKGPIWITGKLKIIEGKTTQKERALYEIHANQVEAYK